MFSCKRCGYSSKSKSGLKTHLRRKNPCPATNSNASPQSLIAELDQDASTTASLSASPAPRPRAVASTIRTSSTSSSTSGVGSMKPVPGAQKVADVAFDVNDFVQKTLQEALNPPEYQASEADKKTLATVAQVKELEARVRRLESKGVGGKTNNITNNICVYQISPGNLLNLAFMTTPTFMQKYLGQEPGEGLTLMETPGVPEFQQAMRNALQMAMEKTPMRADPPKFQTEGLKPPDAGAKKYVPIDD